MKKDLFGFVLVAFSFLYGRMCSGGRPERSTSIPTLRASKKPSHFNFSGGVSVMYRIAAGGSPSPSRYARTMAFPSALGTMAPASRM